MDYYNGALERICNFFTNFSHVLATKFYVSKNYNHFLGCKCKIYVSYHTKSINALGYLPLDVFKFVIVFCVERYLSYSRSKFMWMMGLTHIMTKIFFKRSYLFEIDHYMPLTKVN